MILIFGGTTEGRIAIQTLEEAGKTFYYSTKGDEQDVLLHNGIRLQGAMDAIEIETFCAQHHIKLLIDAAHPLPQLHETLEQVSVESNIPSSVSSVSSRNAMKNTSPGAGIMTMPSRRYRKKRFSSYLH